MRKSLIYALLVTLGVVELMLYWFAYANCAVVFLYDHDMGPLFPDTSAFSLVTRSRYWMTGLVQRRLHVKPERHTALLAAGVCWAYLFLPAAHHLLFSDGWFYITTMDNVFPNGWLIFVAGWTVTGLAVSLVVRLRRRGSNNVRTS